MFNKKRLRHFLHDTEVFIDKLITPAVLVLIVVIIIEFFFIQLAEKYATPITITDGIVVGIFVIDLIFKYNHVRNIPKFIKYFWLDILAVFPFFLLFRAFEGLAAFASLGERTQTLLHQGIILEQEGSRLVREAEQLSKVSEFSRFIRPITRLPRILKLAPHHSKKAEEIREEKKDLYKRILKKANIKTNKQ